MQLSHIHNAPFCNRNVHGSTFLLQNGTCWDSMISLALEKKVETQLGNHDMEGVKKIRGTIALYITSNHWSWVSSQEKKHYIDVIMGPIAFQITSHTIVYSTVYSDADQRKHHSSASLAVVREIHRGPVNSPHKWAVTRKIFPLTTSSWFTLRSRTCTEPTLHLTHWITAWILSCEF